MMGTRTAGWSARGLHVGSHHVRINCFYLTVDPPIPNGYLASATGEDKELRDVVLTTLYYLFVV